MQLSIVLKNNWLLQTSIRFISQDHFSLENNPEGVKHSKHQTFKRPVGLKGSIHENNSLDYLNGREALGGSDERHHKIQSIINNPWCPAISFPFSLLGKHLPGSILLFDFTLVFRRLFPGSLRQQWILLRDEVTQERGGRPHERAASHPLGPSAMPAADGFSLTASTCLLPPRALLRPCLWEPGN